jgi:DNA-directed RNA polymerase specialized sigma24 family protein
MLTSRTPLRPIFSNKVKKKLLTLHKKSQIVESALFGYKPDEIAKVLNKPKSTVRSILKIDLLRNEKKILLRSGRLKN